MRSLFSFCFIIMSFAALGQGEIYSDTESFLNKHVSDGKVDYDAIVAKPAELNTLIEQYEAFNLLTSRPQEKKAFWINAYNIMVIKGVVRKFPIAKPTDVEGFFEKPIHKVAGQMLSLNDIENKMLRTPYGDPRIHFVLVCAAVSCPPIVPFAYLPRKIDSQLESQTRQALNDDNFVRINSASRTVEISEIFKWYQEDFLSKHGSLLAYINAYRDEAIPAGYTVNYYPYNWSLNEKKK